MFRNRTIRARLIAGFGLALLLLIGLSVISSMRVQGIKSDLTVMNSINSVKQRYAINFRGSVHDRAISLRDVVLLADPAVPKEEIRTLSEAYRRSAAPLDAMLAPDTNPSAEELTILAAIKDVEQRTLPLIAEVIARRDRGDNDGARQLLVMQARPLFVEWLRTINQFIDLQEARNRAIAEEVSATTSNFLLVTLLLCLAAVGLSGAVAWSIIRSLAPIQQVAAEMNRLADEGNGALAQERGGDELARMNQALEAMRRGAEQRTRLADEKKVADAEQEMVVRTLGSHLDKLAAGDVSTEITEHFPHGYRQLRMAYNSAIQSLGGLIRSVGDSTAQIRTGSSEIAQASDDLARRTESNAASLEQTSAAIQQMDQRLKASASAATQTVGRADQAIAIVGGGRELADEAVQAMGRVSDSAKGIDSVIEGLDKIAFQTRVLAMNAAVEAGRAGDAGRGFAVVADLVSALAMRAEEEAKRARNQLTLTQTDIVTAVGAVEKVDAALQNISSDVGEVHQLLGSMASDNQAQALAITEINAAIASMDQSTQQNAAMVEQTSAAARNLLGEVGSLSDQAARLRCGTAAVLTAPPVATRVPTPTKPASAPPKPKAQPMAAKPSASPAVNVRPEPVAALPGRGKEGAYQSPVRALPSMTVEALGLGSGAPVAGLDDDDWKEF